MQISIDWLNTSDQQRLCVQRFGHKDKPALVLVHGYPDNQSVWEGVIEQLCDDYQIITYDVRGAGDSSVPSKIRDYQLSRLSQDLEEVVDAVIPGQAFHLAAHDWGSIQSWESVTEPKFKGRILSYSSISGPCLDHAAFWMKAQLQEKPHKFIKQLSKSWYIGVFQLPFLAPLAWRFIGPERWGRMVEKLERQDDLALNMNVQQDGQYGVALYRANFITRLLNPRERYAICPVQAIVLKHDRFVSPELADEIPKWSKQFQKVELNANHWAVLSQPEAIAKHIHQFIRHHSR